MTYRTKSGDTWDTICQTLTGATDQTAALMAANEDYEDVFIFDAGVLISVPDFEPETDTSKYPPWRSS